MSDKEIKLVEIIRLLKYCTTHFIDFELNVEDSFVLKEYFDKTQQENKQLKEVVAEVKEFVDCYLSTYENADEQVLYLDADDISKLLQILNTEIL